MKPSDLSPYVWNALLNTFRVSDTSNDTYSITEASTAASSWLSTASPSSVFSRILSYEGIIGYDHFILTLVRDLKLG